MKAKLIKEGTNKYHIKCDYKDINLACYPHKPNKHKLSLENCLEITKDYLKNEWDVEIDMTPYYNRGGDVGDKTISFKPDFKPTLDNQDCLIIKNIKI